MNITREKRKQYLIRRRQNYNVEDGMYQYTISNTEIKSNVPTNNGIATDIITIMFNLTNETNKTQTNLSVKYNSFLKDYNSSKRFYYFLNIVERAYKNTTMYDEIFPAPDEFNVEALSKTSGTLEVKNNEYNGKKYSNISEIFPNMLEDTIEINSSVEIL